MKRHIKLKHLDIGDDPPQGKKKDGKDADGEEYYRDDEDEERGRNEGEEKERMEDKCTGSIGKGIENEGENGGFGYRNAVIQTSANATIGIE